jgi:CRP-like cAMP-binding protein
MAKPHAAARYSIDLLERVFVSRGWLAHVDPAVRQLLLGAATVREISPDYAIAVSGDEGGGIFGLLHGRVGCWGASEFALPVLSHVAVAGDWFGHGPIQLGVKRSATFRSLEPCVLLHLPAPVLRELGRNNPQLYRELTKLSETSSQLMVALLTDALMPTAERRLAAKLLRAAGPDSDSDSGQLAQVALPLSQAALAELACVSRSQVSRILRQWKKRGLIEIGYNKVRLLLIEELHAIAKGEDI